MSPTTKPSDHLPTSCPATRVVALLLLVLLGSGLGNADVFTRADAALELCNALGITPGKSKQTLYGLFPSVFPGGYDGELDVSMWDSQATLETVIVALVRWAGWDVVHYDERLVEKVKPHVSPEGFPYYKPDPTPRAIPYVIVALQVGILADEELSRLRAPISREEVRDFADRAKRASASRASQDVIVMNGRIEDKVLQAQSDSTRLVVLPSGFAKYDLLNRLSNRILDLNTPSTSFYNAGSRLSNGKQDYFPLGPLDTQLSVGLHVPSTSYSHQAEAILGDIENHSETVNAVAIWGRASSKQKNARVWGGFISSATSSGADHDAQVIGLEIDVINAALPGSSPNRSKTGLQIVGIGTASVTNGIEVIGAGPAKWSNGLLVMPNAIDPKGAVIGVSGPGAYDRGIDLAGVRFNTFALGVGLGDKISFKGKGASNSALIYTDDFEDGHIVIQAGKSGLRITDNANRKNLLRVDESGAVTTAHGPVGVRVATPSSATAQCIPGAWSSDEKYFYVCTAANQWRRASLSSW